ncbi:sigma-70 family RNA polymerase sigma factor [Streptomyces sp. NPDC059176]|uniref:sigma-70 family RNA polymerase sigma factor n=1 Tax=unclassified Streptomyces TaxID=2593676 RepID=UPI0036B16797
MKRENLHGIDVVTAARDGDQHAREQLVADYLPLIYNIVGRALDGHADVDDVVQDTMLRVLHGIGGLREPSRFRSWMVAIAVNEIRHRWHNRQRVAATSLESVPEGVDRGPDFVDLTILQLELSGQRREVAEATRWLDGNDREVLALWWEEAAGRLTRDELATALDVTPQHAGVRVQRMKERLEVSRVVVRAVGSRPRCVELGEITAGWDGTPSSVWRKRIARHARTCPACSTHWADLVPPQGLLAGTAMVVPLYGYPAVPPSSYGPDGHPDPVGSTTDPSGAASGVNDPPGTVPGGEATGGAGGGWPVVGAAGGGAVAGALLLALLWPGSEQAPEPRAVRTTIMSPTPSASPSTPTRTPTPTPTPPPTLKPSPTPAAVKPEQRLTELVNVRRARAGCAPLRIDPRLSEAARKHAQDMVARGYFDHANPEGLHADERISAAGYDWGSWGENLDQGTSDPSVVVEDWMDGSIHQENMLDCEYRDVGVGTAKGPDGTVWVQNLARPA